MASDFAFSPYCRVMSFWLWLTCEVFLPYFEGVHNGGEDALDSPEHAAQSQIDQHKEKHDRPKRRGWEMGHGFSEGDEGQACALHRL